jgi:ankyrin repeat protein
MPVSQKVKVPLTKVSQSAHVWMFFLYRRMYETEPSRRSSSLPTDTTSMKVLDIILDDDSDRLSDFLASADIVDRCLSLDQYHMPPMLRTNPSISALCAFFGAVNCFNYLLLISFDDNIKDDHLHSLDHFAAAGGNMEIIRSLEALGHKFDGHDRSSFAPVDYAAQMGHIVVVQWLWSKGLFSTGGFEYNSPFLMACLMGHLDIVRFLYEEEEKSDEPHDILGKSMRGRTPIAIHFACRGGHSDIVSYLISQGSPIHNLDFDGLTPLQICAGDGSLSCLKLLVDSAGIVHPSDRRHSALLAAAASGHFDIVKFLIERGANPQGSDSRGITPLIGAVANGRIGIAAYLIEQGGILPESLELLLQKASASHGAELIPLILEHLPESERLESYAPMMMEQAMEVEDCDLIDFLLSKGIDFDGEAAARAFQRKHGSFLDFLVERGITVSGDAGGRFVLKALSTGDSQRAKELMDAGARLTPELIARDPECLKILVRRHDEESVNMLLDYHPDLSGAWSLIPIAVDRICTAVVSNGRRLSGETFS